MLIDLDLSQTLHP